MLQFDKITMSTLNMFVLQTNVIPAHFTFDPIIYWSHEKVFHGPLQNKSVDGYH